MSLSLRQQSVRGHGSLFDAHYAATLYDCAPVAMMLFECPRDTSFYWNIAETRSERRVRVQLYNSLTSMHLRPNLTMREEAVQLRTYDEARIDERGGRLRNAPQIDP